MTGGISLYAVLDFGNCLCIIQVNLLQEKRGFHEVHMAVGKTREDEAAFGINDTRLGPFVVADLAVCPDGEDSPIAEGESFGPGMGGVDGVDAGVENDCVGGLLRCAMCWGQ